jgi:hypothetical protein
VIDLRARLEWWHRNSENFAALLLAIAALATAWSGYQASTWGGIQAAQYTMSSVLRGKAGRASDEAARNRFLDMALFTRWFEANADGRTRLSALYEVHFRPEFRVAFDAWRTTTGGETMASLPFERPEYHLQRARDAEHYDSAAARALDLGQRANDISDAYVFVTVILATVLFFAGAVRPLVAPRTRGIVLLMATLLCLWGLIRLVTEPVAR